MDMEAVVDIGTPREYVQPVYSTVTVKKLQVCVCPRTGTQSSRYALNIVPVTIPTERRVAG